MILYRTLLLQEPNLTRSQSSVSHFWFVQMTWHPHLLICISHSFNWQATVNIVDDHSISIAINLSTAICLFMDKWNARLSLEDIVCCNNNSSNFNHHNSQFVYLWSIHLTWIGISQRVILFVFVCVCRCSTGQWTHCKNYNLLLL